MSDVLDRLRKKRAHKVTIEGEDYWVRPLTIGELKRLECLDSTRKTGFVMGCALCADNQAAPEMPKGDESDDAWADRVLSALADVPTETIHALSVGVAQIGKTPNLETDAKNLPATQQPA